MFWENFEQASQRLNNCYMMYGDRAVHISDTSPDGCYTQFLTEPGVMQILSFDDPLWRDFRNHVTSTFVNTVKGVYYVERRPSRTIVHGLSRQSALTYRYDTSVGAFVRWDYNIDRLREAYGVDLGDAWEGRFPSFKEALDLLSTGKYKSIALSPQYCLTQKMGGSITIFKQMKEIGFVSKESGLVLLFKGRSFLREEFAEQVPDLLPVMEL